MSSNGGVVVRFLACLRGRRAVFGLAPLRLGLRSYPLGLRSYPGLALLPFGFALLPFGFALLPFGFAPFAVTPLHSGKCAVRAQRPCRSGSAPFGPAPFGLAPSGPCAVRAVRPWVGPAPFQRPAPFEGALRPFRQYRRLPIFRCRR